LVTVPKADEFFKLWRQRKDETGKPWGDAQMLKASEMEQHVLLEEMGFPALLDDKGKVKPRGLHPFRISSYIYSVASSSNHLVFLIAVFSCPQPVPLLRNSESDRRGQKLGAAISRIGQSKPQAICRSLDEAKFPKT